LLSLRYPDQQDCKPSPAKVAQEQLIEAAGQPYTTIRSTQFFEFLRAIADSAWAQPPSPSGSPSTADRAAITRLTAGPARPTCRRSPGLTRPRPHKPAKHSGE
jgi:uncharacterized protein YbjT (DUF2867 family)